MINYNNIKWKSSTDNRTIYAPKLSYNLGNDNYTPKKVLIQAEQEVNGVIQPNIYGLTYPKHRPLKIYRKQYNPINSKSNISYIGVFDKPGLSTYKLNEDICDLSNNLNLFNNNIINSNQENLCYKTVDKNDPTNIIMQSCNYNNKIIKSASTIINSNYSYNTNQYLYKRNKSYIQNLNTNIKSGICCDKTLTYKSGGIIKNENTNPNNNNSTNLNNQVSNSSSSRIERLKYDTNQKYKSQINYYQQQIKNVSNNKCNDVGILFKKTMMTTKC